MKCDVDLHKEVYANVVPLGGTAIFQGIVQHMTKERTVLATSTMRSRWLLHPIASTLYGPSRPTSSRTETSLLSALNVSVALKCFPSQDSLVTKTSGVHDTSFRNNMKRDVDIRKELYANVGWSSGTTMSRWFFDT